MILGSIVYDDVAIELLHILAKHYVYELVDLKEKSLSVKPKIISISIKDKKEVLTQ